MKHLEVHLHTNTNCNLYCLHCYNNSGDNDIQKTHFIPSIEALIESIRFICDTYDAEIHLEGGEIFLRPDLLRKMDSLPDSCLQSITITTNGTIWTEDQTICHMLKRIAALRVSVESADPQQHAQIRGVSLFETLHNASRYKHLGIPLYLRLTLNKLNRINFVSNNILKLAEEGFQQFQVYEFQRVGRGLHSEKMLALEDSLNSLIDELCDLSLDGIKLKMLFPQTRVQEILASRGRLESCGFMVNRLLPEEGISIHANGDVYRCAWDSDPSHVICNWYQDSAAKQIIQTTCLMHVCNHCSAISIISG